MTLSTGQTLRDRYRIDSLLGQGGMGAVYKGWDNSLAVACAIKENQLFTDVAVRQFEREARLLATLRHSNLPRVTDHFFIPGQGQYLVMDFIEGEDLKQRIERIGPLPEADVRRWAWDILNALQYLHERGVVHRDIKPANIKIAPDGTAVLVDFGIAKEIDAEDGTTTTGARGLTPGFAPPEQYGVGTSRTDARSDLYAFGATLYNLLTGKIPLDALSRLTQPQKFQPVTAHGISVSQRLMDVIDRAMAMDPDRRFASAEEMRTGKRAATDSTQLPATLPPGETVTPSTTLSPDLSATVAGSTRIVPPITKVATAQSDQTTSPLAAQPRWLVWGGIALVVLITLGGLGVMARVILRGGPAAPTTPTQGPTTELPTTVPLAATADLFISGTQTALAAQSVAITETANAQGTAAGSFALTQTAFAEVAEQSNSGTQTAIAHQVATQAAAATRTTIAQTAVSAFANTQTALALSATSTRTATGTATRTATVTATATNTATFTASPTPPPLPTISLNPASVSLVLGSSADLTVSISIAQSSNTLISLSSSNGSVASTASSVTIPPGATSASFSVDGQGAGAATLTASLPGNLGGGSASATANVDKGPTTTTFTLNQNIVIVGQSVTATYLVTGAGTITGDVEISVEGVVVCVASAPSGSCVGTPVSVGVKTVKVTYLGDANFNGSEGTVALSVNGLSIALDPSFSCTTANAVTLTARINVAQPNDTLVTLSSDSASNVQPAVTIPAGSLSATFPVVRASGVFNATSTIRAQLPASLGGDNALARVEFAAPPPFGNC